MPHFPHTVPRQRSALVLPTSVFQRASAFGTEHARLGTKPVEDTHNRLLLSPANVLGFSRLGNYCPLPPSMPPARLQPLDKPAAVGPAVIVMKHARVERAPSHPFIACRNHVRTLRLKPIADSSPLWRYTEPLVNRPAATFPRGGFSPLRCWCHRAGRGKLAVPPASNPGLCHVGLVSWQRRRG